jgi:ribonuclease-3 family protein
LRVYFFLPICYDKKNILFAGGCGVDNYFLMHMDRKDINSVSNLGLAHIGDAVYELMCRCYLCARGERTVKNLHRDSVALVKAPTQAAFADKLMPHLTEEELAYFRRGKNAHSHAAPKSATPQEYAKATGLETLFGALYLAGQTDRLDQLFAVLMEKFFLTRV